MNEILLNILSAVVTTVLLPLLTLAGVKLTQLITAKVKNEKAATLLTTATDIVLNAVRCVFQTYVDALKKSGTFDTAAQTTALTKAKTIALTQISEETKEGCYGDYYQDRSKEADTEVKTGSRLCTNFRGYG